MELSQKPPGKRIASVVSYNKTLKIRIRIQFESKPVKMGHGIVGAHIAELIKLAGSGALTMSSRAGSNHQRDCESSPHYAAKYFLMPRSHDITQKAQRRTGPVLLS